LRDMRSMFAELGCLNWTDPGAVKAMCADPAEFYFTLVDIRNLEKCGRTGCKVSGARNTRLLWCSVAARSAFVWRRCGIYRLILDIFSSVKRLTGQILIVRTPTNTSVFVRSPSGKKLAPYPARTGSECSPRFCPRRR
jgi:hypothetical protein